MAKRRSYSVAPNDSARSRVLSWSALTGIGVLALGALVLVFPRTDLLTILRGESAQGNRDLSIAYLRNLIRTEPNDLGLQLLLVEKLLDGGDFAATRLALTKALPLARASPEGQIAWDRWDLAIWQTRLAKAQTSGDLAESRGAAAELMARLKRRVDSPASSGGVTNAQEVFALDSALGNLQGALGVAGSPLMDEAKNIHRLLLARLLTLPKVNSKDLARAGTLALADGQFQQSSALFLLARQRTDDSTTQLQLLKRAVQAQLASGEPRLAWRLASDELKNLPSGSPDHWWLAELALGAAEPREAGLALRRYWPSKVNLESLSTSMTPVQVQLAWDIFSAAGDLPSALQMADVALLQGPGSVIWLERKAQTSEWAGRAPQALASWLVLMKQGQRSALGDRALSNVFRLAPMLYNDDALLAAWLALAKQRPLTIAEATQVVDLYEKLGAVDQALAFVRQQQSLGGQGNQTKPSHWQSAEAKLLERVGRTSEAIEVLEQMRQVGLSAPDAMLLATIYLRKGQPPLALRALQSVQQDKGPLDADYWNLLADLAYLAGQRSLALQALDQVMAIGKPQAFQVERAIRLRLDIGSFADAAQLAAKMYPRFPQDNLVYAWIDAISAQGPPTGLASLLSQLEPAHRARLEKLPVFLNRRAGLYVRLNDFAMAKQDYQRSLSLRPGDRPTRAAYLWLLIDQQETMALQSEINKLSNTEKSNAAFNQVLTAAYQLLDQPQRALVLMQQVAKSRGTDFLWLMNYADVLDRLDRQPQALRVRRHAWPLAQRAAQRPVDKEQGRQALLVQLRLAGDFAGGETKAHLWRQLGRLVQNSKSPAEKRQAQELVGAWLLSQGSFDAAQSWLWAQHAARVTVPNYQEFALALALDDKQTLTRLLDKAEVAGPNRLGPAERLAALRQLGRSDAVAELGFALANARPEGPDDDSQAALQRDLLGVANRATLQTRATQTGSLSRFETKVDTSLRLNDQFKLNATVSANVFASSDSTAIAAVPSRDIEVRAGVEAKRPWGDVNAHVTLRDALATTAGFGLQVKPKLGNRANATLEAALAERADESSALLVAGLRDRVAATVSFQTTSSLNTQASLTQNHYRTQTGAPLGGAVDAALSASLALGRLGRTHLDTRLQAQLKRSVVRADGTPDAGTGFLQAGGTAPAVALFLGPSSTSLSASLGLGLAQSDPASYSRAWKPWGEIGFETRQTDVSVQTQGLLRLGIKGALLGRDQFSVNLDVRPSSAGGAAALGSSEVGVRYDLFFNR